MYNAEMAHRLQDWAAASIESTEKGGKLPLQSLTYRLIWN